MHVYCVYMCVYECIVNMCVRAYVCVFAIPLFGARYVFVVYVCDAMGRRSNELVLLRWLFVDPSGQVSLGLEEAPSQGFRVLLQGPWLQRARFFDPSSLETPWHARRASLLLKHSSRL